MFPTRNPKLLGLAKATLFTMLAVSPVFAQPQPFLAEDTSTNSEIPIEQLQNFANVINNIKHFYVKPVEDKELFENAIRGMLAGLDPHSSFLDKNDFEELKTATTGKFGGLGIEVTMEDGFVKVISPIDDTPASKAGLKPGDLIVKIDKTPVKGLDLKQAVDLMRGDPNTSIKLLVIREKATAPLDLTLMREIIKIKSVKSEIIEDNYGYVKVSQFQADTADNIISAINSLKASTKNKKLNGLVLDLRNNPGGILTGAINVADIFLDHLKLNKNTLIVSTKGRTKDTESNAYAKTGDLTGGVPMVVLVNNGSASASEIVAGALQDHKRAIIMGTTTFGKGSVQTVLPLQGDQGLKLTTALYYTPSGRSIQAAGIVPDVTVEALELKTTVDKFGSTSEADLKDHLANGNADKVKALQKIDAMVESTTATDKKDGKPAADSKNKNAADTTTAATTIPEEKKTLAEKDYQLFEAINLLKGMQVLAKS